jgi:hypothetical protein
VIAGSLLVHTWQFTAADHAFGLALQGADGPLEQIAVAGQQCFALTPSGDAGLMPGTGDRSRR